MRTNERGFVALMSVIIVSAILLVLIFTLGTAAFFDRFDIVDSENKRVSLGLAEACVNAAMLKIAQDPTYTPQEDGDCVHVGDTCPAPKEARVWKTCKICSVVTAGHFSTIDLRAVYGGAYTDLVVGINSTPGDASILSWAEVPVDSALCTVP